MHPGSSAVKLLESKTNNFCSQKQTTFGPKRTLREGHTYVPILSILQQEIYLMQETYDRLGLTRK